MMKTSIIIPTSNGRHLLLECVRSIREHTEPTICPYEIIVVDNGSYDGTLDYCVQEEIPFISLPVNTGFPTACNMGLRIASGDALLLLNNDTLVTSHWLDNMLECLCSSEDIGIVGPTTNYASGRQKVEIEYKDIPHFMHIAEKINRPDRRKWQRTERIIGLCFLFRRELLDRIGFLDEQFSPGHYEDDDYCYRARLAGFHLKIAGDVIIYHHGSASFRQTEATKMAALINENHRKFIAKWGVNPHDFI